MTPVRNGLELVYGIGEDALTIATRASDLLGSAGQEREACEMRSRVMVALETQCGRETILGVVDEYVVLLSRQYAPLCSTDSP